MCLNDNNTVNEFTSGVTVFFYKCKRKIKTIYNVFPLIFKNTCLTGECGFPYLVGGFFAGFFGLSDVNGCSTALDLMSLRLTPGSKQRVSL